MSGRGDAGGAAVIGLGAATRVHMRMSWLRLRRGRVGWAVALLAALPLVYTIALALGGHWGRGLFDDVCELYFRFLVPFVPSLLLASAVAEEVEGKTFTFVFARPAPRGALVLGKWAAATLPGVVLLAPTLALIWVVAHVRFAGDMLGELPHLLRVEAAALLALAAFGALAAAVGALFSRHPLVAVLGYLVLIEAGLGSAPLVLNLVALTWHARNLAELPLPSVDGLALAVPAWASALWLALVTPGLLAVTMAGVRGAEYRTDR